jgi:hypothetical protein
MVPLLSRVMAPMAEYRVTSMSMPTVGSVAETTTSVASAKVAASSYHSPTKRTPV